MHRIVVVTAAGRRKYLELLKHYVLSDHSIDAWHLWDNCRNEADKKYIYELERASPKISIVTIPGSDGTNSSVNRYYVKCRDTDVFYIKMDDDIVFLPKGFGHRLYTKAFQEKNKYTWWSPLVVNNALCTWLLKYHGRVHIGDGISAQAGCQFGWRSPIFALALHELFLQAMATENFAVFQVPNFEVSLSRFSINCIGFFGDFVSRLTEADFCPPGVDDEEWISAVLPSRVGKPGRIVGDIIVSHFSYFTQEHVLLSSDILNRYYKLAKLEMDPSYGEIPKESLKARFKRRLINRLLIGDQRPDIALLREGDLSANIASQKS
jgi:hypothetical protein